MANLDIKMFFARREFVKNRARFYESIGNSMLKDGVPLLECLRKLAQRSEEDGRPVARLFRLWVKRMGDTASKGEFSLVIKRDVPNSDYMILRGFEQSKKLPEGILYQANIIKRISKMRSTFIMSMIKPLLSVFSMVGLSMFFSSAARAFLENAPMEKWPAPSQAMFKWTIFIDDYAMLILPITVISLMWLSWSMPNWGNRNARLRHKLDGFLPYVAYRDFASFQTLIVLSSLMSSGAPLKISCQMILDTGSPWVRSYFRKIVKRLGDASITSPVKAFDVGFLQKDIYYRILDSSERGDFDTAVKRIAEDSFENMEESMKTRSFIMEQIATLIAGAIAALIALGLVSAIGSISALLKAGGGAS